MVGEKVVGWCDSQQRKAGGLAEQAAAAGPLAAARAAHRLQAAAAEAVQLVAQLVGCENKNIDFMFLSF